MVFLISPQPRRMLIARIRRFVLFLKDLMAKRGGGVGGGGGGGRPAQIQPFPQAVPPDTTSPKKNAKSKFFYRFPFA